MEGGQVGDAKITLPQDDDYDLGGEGGGGVIGVTTGETARLKEISSGDGEGIKKEDVEMEEAKQVVGRGKEEDQKSGEKTVIVISDDSSEEVGKGKASMAAGSRGSAASVPPGFQRIYGARRATQEGSQSPFGKLQRGGFRFLKRSSSTASTGARGGAAQKVKKTKPISALPPQAIDDVARNVGVAEQLTKEQVAKLKAMEEDRASS